MHNAYILFSLCSYRPLGTTFPVGVRIAKIIDNDLEVLLIRVPGLDFHVIDARRITISTGLGDTCSGKDQTQTLLAWSEGRISPRGIQPPSPPMHRPQRLVSITGCLATPGPGPPTVFTGHTYRKVENVKPHKHKLNGEG